MSAEQASRFAFVRALFFRKALRPSVGNRAEAWRAGRLSNDWAHRYCWAVDSGRVGFQNHKTG
jgi:hypothetical protein